MGDPSAVRAHRTEARWLLRLSRGFFALGVFFVVAALAALLAGRGWETISEQVEALMWFLVGWRWLRLEALESADTALAIDSGWEKPDLTTRIRALLPHTETKKESRS